MIQMDEEYKRIEGELKDCKNITYHNSVQDLISILEEPLYLSFDLPLPVRKAKKLRVPPKKEFHTISFNLYDDNLLVERGSNSGGSAMWQASGRFGSGIYFTASRKVGETIFIDNLFEGRKITHVLRIEEYTDFHTKKFVKKHPKKADIYEFRKDPELVQRYKAEKKRSEFSHDSLRNFFQTTVNYIDGTGD